MFMTALSIAVALLLWRVEEQHILQHKMWFIFLCAGSLSGQLLYCKSKTRNPSLLRLAYDLQPLIRVGSMGDNFRQAQIESIDGRSLPSALGQEMALPQDSRQVRTSCAREVEAGFRRAFVLLNQACSWKSELFNIAVSRRFFRPV